MAASTPARGNKMKTRILKRLGRLLAFQVGNRTKIKYQQGMEMWKFWTIIHYAFLTVQSKSYNIAVPKPILYDLSFSSTVLDNSLSKYDKCPVLLVITDL